MLSLSKLANQVLFPLLRGMLSCTNLPSYTLRLGSKWLKFCWQDHKKESYSKIPGLANDITGGSYTNIYSRSQVRISLEAEAFLSAKLFHCLELFIIILISARYTWGVPYGTVTYRICVKPSFRSACASEGSCKEILSAVLGVTLATPSGGCPHGVARVTPNTTIVIKGKTTIIIITYLGGRLWILFYIASSWNVKIVLGNDHRRSTTVDCFGVVEGVRHRVDCFALKLNGLSLYDLLWLHRFLSTLSVFGKLLRVKKKPFHL